jgi:hypothetical protein
LNYAYLDSDKIKFKLPNTSNWKLIKKLNELKSIEIDIVKVVDWNNIDLDKLKT